MHVQGRKRHVPSRRWKGETQPPRETNEPDNKGKKGKKEMRRITKQRGSKRKQER